MYQFNSKIPLLFRSVIFTFLVMGFLIGSYYVNAEPISIKNNERYRKESESVINYLFDNKNYRGGSFGEISFRIDYKNLSAEFYKIKNKERKSWHVKCENFPVDSEKKCLLTHFLRSGPAYLEFEMVEILISSKWQPILKIKSDSVSQPLSVPKVRLENNQAFYLKNKSGSKKNMIFELEQRENQEFFSKIFNGSPRDFYISDSVGNQYSLSTEVLMEGFFYSKWVFENSQ